MSDGVVWGQRNVSQDAVILVPGIMGSRLRLRESGDVVWGLDVSWYSGAWFRNEPWRQLAVTEAERDGQTNRVVADGLIDDVAFAPVLGGFLPYQAIGRRIRSLLADPAGYLEFGYDWRLSATHNAGLLAETVERHITAWRAHPSAIAAQRGRPDQRAPQVILVAHSMGGLVCRAMYAIPGAADDVRAILTLGTPFRGAAQAAVILATGQGTPFPLPRKRLRRMAKTLPGLHDLLPVYRSVDEGHDVRRLTDADVAAVGGDVDLGRESRDRHAALAAVRLPGHQAYIGGFQPTPSTLRLSGGEVVAEPYSYLVSSDGSLVRDAISGDPRQVIRFGDGTVPLASALPDTITAVTVSQQHGSLARVEEALSQAAAILLEEDRAVQHLGESELGFDLPDLVEVNTVVSVPLTGQDAAGATCTLYDEAGHDIAHPPVKLRAGQRVVDILCPSPGIHRLEVQGGGSGPVGQSVLAHHPSFGEPDDEPGDN
jgi:hypothetical protein